MSKKIKLLYLCTGNSCRSQMAEGWTHALKSDVIDVYSAGLETHGLNPNAVKVMAEAGVDISNQKSQHLDEFSSIDLDVVITVCGHAHETCPLFPANAQVIHVGFDDPPKLTSPDASDEEKLNAFRRVRDEIKAFVETLPDGLEENIKSNCCCTKKRILSPWIIGERETPAGKVPTVGTILSFHDKWGALKVRCAIGRNRYMIPPGLYAIGNPTPESPVFVSANYKLSFDHLRCALDGIDGWILVLDTQGINVWCAAGKGTFGTEEIVDRVEETELYKVVSHQKLIVPQLGAPGISAMDVKKECGFNVLYGPVRAEDLPAFLAAEFKATPEMRRVHFTLRDRIAVIPVELVIWFKQALGLAVVLALLSGISRSGYTLALAPRALGLVFAGWLTGGALVPILLPWLPGRSFALKGLWAGLLLWLILLIGSPGRFALSMDKIGWGLILTAIVSFMALNFTGTSTYTSMSGVKKEMKIAIPIQLIATILGTALILLGGLQ